MSAGRVDLLLPRFLDVSVAVTDSAMPKVRIFILLLLVVLGGTRTSERWSCHDRRLGTAHFTVGGSHIRLDPKASRAMKLQI
jgi:hypothetical protein